MGRGATGRARRCFGRRPESERKRGLDGAVFFLLVVCFFPSPETFDDAHSSRSRVLGLPHGRCDSRRFKEKRASGPAGGWSYRGLASASREAGSKEMTRTDSFFIFFESEEVG